jgi:sugar O-acyltransferase (sialic acid O-acetyltransferase NeuD family)
MKKDEIHVLGIGHNTIAYIELLGDCGYSIAGLWHYNNERVGENYFGYNIIGCVENFLSGDLSRLNFSLSMGNIDTRTNLYQRIVMRNGNIPSIIHPTAVVSKYSKLGDGVCVFPHSVIQADVEIGNNVVITMGTTIAHSTKIGNNCFIAGHCLVGAFITVEDNVHIGQGSIIVSGEPNMIINIGEKCILGAGSVMRGNMKSNSIYLGNPARFIKYRNGE